MENTVKKENWIVQKWRQFKEWKRKTDLKIDYWSRKKPLRRKLYLNRTLYVMMLPYVLLFTALTNSSIAALISAWLINGNFSNIVNFLIIVSSF